MDPQSLAWLSAERLTTGTGTDVAACLSPDGTRLAFSTQRETARLWVLPFDPVAGRVIGEGSPVSVEEGVETSDLSRDGRAVAYGVRQPGTNRVDIWVTDVDGGTPELVAQNARGPVWSPDGKAIAYFLFRSGPSSAQDAGREPTGEWALAMRELAGPEYLLSRWSAKALLAPSDWTVDGQSIQGSYASPIFTGFASIALWPRSARAAAAPARVLLADSHRSLWQGRYSPNGRWIVFVALPHGELAHEITLMVAPADGAPPAEWIRLAPAHAWLDKPRWAPDGKMIYFLSRRESAYFNLWGIRFDPERGKTVGDPFRITRYDSPARMISTNMGNTEIGISAKRALLTMTTVTGSIWMLDNVDR